MRPGTEVACVTLLATLWAELDALGVALNAGSSSPALHAEILLLELALLAAAFDRLRQERCLTDPEYRWLATVVGGVCTDLDLEPFRLPYPGAAAAVGRAQDRLFEAISVRCCAAAERVSRAG